MSSEKFSAESRYYGFETLSMVVDNQREVAYLERRFIPAPDRFATVSYEQIQQGDRPDRLANRLAGDPLLYWKIADANSVMRPVELTATVGGRIRVTLPEGVPAYEESV